MQRIDSLLMRWANHNHPSDAQGENGKKGQKMTTDSEENMDMKMIKEITQRILMLMAMSMEDESQSHTGKDLYCYGSCLQILWALRCNIREK